MTAGAGPVDDLPGPVFVGGTGRSGTHAMARLLGRHSAYYYFSREMRFHTDRGGFPDLLAGRVSVDEFIHRMRGPFWARTGADGRTRGLRGRFQWEAYEAALAQFRHDYDDDPRAACRDLMHGLLDPLAKEAGKRTWIEQTPPTVMAAPTLHAIFPRMRMIHMVRDGRDVAASVVTRSWGPSSLSRAMRWWEESLRAAHVATSMVPDENVLLINLEDLVENKRGRTYRKVLRFLEVESERPVQRYFRRKVTAEAANIGRWRVGLSESRQRKVTDQYRRALEGMGSDGIRSAPSLRRAGLLEQSPRTPSPSRPVARGS